MMSRRAFQRLLRIVITIAWYCAVLRLIYRMGEDRSVLADTLAVVLYAFIGFACSAAAAIALRRRIPNLYSATAWCGMIASVAIHILAMSNWAQSAHAARSVLVAQPLETRLWLLIGAYPTAAAILSAASACTLLELLRREPAIRQTPRSRAAAAGAGHRDA